MAAPVVQRSFAGGELTPALYGRTELDRYRVSARSLLNLIVWRPGSIRRRPGMEWLRSVAVAQGAVTDCPHRVIRFQMASGSDCQLILRWVYLGDAVPYQGEWWEVWRDGAPLLRASDNAHGDEEYAPATPYGQNAFVHYDGAIYRSRKAANTGNQPDTSPAWWQAWPYIGGPSPIVSKTYGLQVRFSQAGDLLTLTTPGQVVYELRRVDTTWWTLTAAAVPNQADYTVSAVTVDSGSAGDAWHAAKEWTWVVTLVAKGDDGEWREQTGSSSVTDTKALFPDIEPTCISWTEPASPPTSFFYRIYRGRAGVYGLVGEVEGGGDDQFTDDGRDPDFSRQPPVAMADSADNAVFTSAASYPVACAHYEQRAWLGGGGTPNGIWGSELGNPHQFTEPSYGPPQPDHSIGLRLSSTALADVRHLVQMRALLVFTGAGVFEAGPIDGSGLGPQSVYAKEVNARPAHAWLRPLKVGGSVLFVDSTGSVVYHLAPDGDHWQDRDLTAFAGHLLDGYTIVDWDFQSTPEPILWAVRSDGILLGLTFSAEHEVVAWHQHETQGEVQRVCVAREGASEVLYLVVKRSLDNGGSNADFYTFERMTPEWEVDDYRGARHLDCFTAPPARPASSAVTAVGGWDGRNEDTTRTVELNLQGGHAWDEGLVTVDSVSFLVTDSDIGRAWRFHPGSPVSGAEASLEVVITSRNGTNQLLGTITTAQLAAGVDVPFREVATSHWSVAAQTVVSGLDRFNGASNRVTVYGDGVPETQSLVAAGAVSAKERRAVILVGWPFTASCELLECVPAGAETGMRQKGCRKMGLYGEILGSPGVGPDLDGLSTEARPTAPTDTAPEEYSVSRRFFSVLVSHRPDDEGFGAFSQAAPYPFRVLQVKREAVFGEE